MPFLHTRIIFQDGKLGLVKTKEITEDEARIHQIILKRLREAQKIDRAQ
jgi:hypothetical protein